jgi:hypothetical protein
MTDSKDQDGAPSLHPKPHDTPNSNPGEQTGQQPRPVPGAAPSDQTQRLPTLQPSAGQPRTAPAPPIERTGRDPRIPAPPPIQLRREPAAWEEHEPNDPFAPYDHIHAEDLYGVGGWRIVGASRRGKMHAHESKYREDAWFASVSRDQNWNIVGVADGGGSYDLSRVGSHVAVEAAVKNLVYSLPGPGFDDTAAVHGALVKAMNVAFLRLEAKAQELTETLGRPIVTRSLSTTLLLLAWCPSQGIIGVAQVGDGLIALHEGDGKLLQLMQGDNGEVAGATVFLNNVKDLNWDSRIKVYEVTQKPRMLAAMTDGVADDVLESGQNFQILFDALGHYTREAEPAAAVSNWLAYEKRGSFDDRTIVAIYPTQLEQRL